jgi:2,3-bisphosphoglycerate-dependent phosphoglycerate mutase
VRIVATKVFLIRHAEADIGNPPRLCGTFDVPLTPRAHRQLARVTAATLGRPDALYTSPLRRARQTAEAWGQRWQLVPAVVDDLREIHCGALEGELILRIQAEHPFVWATNLAQQDEGFRWPGGESYAEFRGRVLEAFRRIAGSHRDGTVAVVTHAGVITQVLGAIRGRTAAIWDRDRVKPLSITTITWNDAGPEGIVGINNEAWGPAPSRPRG